MTLTQLVVLCDVIAVTSCLNVLVFVQFVCWRRLLCGFWSDGSKIRAKNWMCTSVSLPVVGTLSFSQFSQKSLADTLSFFPVYKRWLMTYRFISWGWQKEQNKLQKEVAKVHMKSHEKTKKWKFYVQTKLSIPDFQTQKHVFFFP